MTTMTAADASVTLVLSTCPETQAAAIARRLVADGLAACVNLVPGLRSFYRWRGELHEDSETLLLIKCRQKVYPALEETLRHIHPYELPEIITVPQVGGLAAYLQWVADPESSA